MEGALRRALEVDARRRGAYDPQAIEPLVKLFFEGGAELRYDPARGFVSRRLPSEVEEPSDRSVEGERQPSSMLSYMLAEVFPKGLLAIRYDPEGGLKFDVSSEGWRALLELRERLYAKLEGMLLKVLYFHEEGYEICVEGDERRAKVVARRPGAEPIVLEELPLSAEEVRENLAELGIEAASMPEGLVA